jgi:alkylation response protein AidB-like acyl-CoA dehydrogenase
LISPGERLQSLGLGFGDTLPLPGSGATAKRHHALMEFGRTDLSLARVAEAHTDALAILAEANATPRDCSLYGVWASDGHGSLVRARPEADGTWRLSGVKQYCTGATFVKSALVTAHHGKDILLFDVDVAARGIRVEPSTWETPALADTATGPVSFDDVWVPGSALLGGPDWYLTRAGFWHGAIGPAACWAGGALSLIDAATLLNRKDAHSRAHVGALQASAWMLSAILNESGREIDADPRDLAGAARVRALKVRHLIERQCTEVLDRFGRATGPQLLAYDAQVARQHMALTLYIRQCHAERDLETIPDVR